MPTYPKQRNSPIAIIVHCSATPFEKDFTIEQIRQMHLQRGFTDIGYHIYIRKDGTICMGRKFEQIGDTIVTGKQIGRASCRERVSSPV